MDKKIQIPGTRGRATCYAALQPQMEALLSGSMDAVAAMANFSAAVQEVFRWHWAGFYRVLDGELVLGPFQGPVACTPIGHGKGVCGQAWARDEVLVVPDVDAFPGHIACSDGSRSEIVVPVHGRSGKVAAVFDVDSALSDDFGQADVSGLTRLCALIGPFFP